MWARLAWLSDFAFVSVTTGSSPRMMTFSYICRGSVSHRRPISIRFISSRASRWLDFEHARQHVQSLRFKTVGEFWLWSKGGRPANIPSDPRAVYAATGWDGFPDFLGYCCGAGSTGSSRVKLSSEVAERRKTGRNNFEEAARAIDTLAEEIGRVAPNVVFLRLPRGNEASLLFRQRQEGDKISEHTSAQWCTNPSGEWWGLRVRATSRIRSDGRLYFRLREDTSETFENTGVVCVSASRRFLRLLAPSETPGKTLFKSWSLHEQTSLSSLTPCGEALPLAFQAWVKKFESRPYLNWLRERRGRGTGATMTRSYVNTLSSRLFTPCGYELAFPRDGDHSCNMLVSGKRVLHRFAKPQLGKPGFRVGVYQRESKRTLPFSKESAKMDVILVSVWDTDVLLGCYVFAREELWDHMSSDTNDGRKWFTVYPLSVELHREKSLFNRKLQDRSFVDMRVPAEQYAKRFKELFERAACDSTLRNTEY